MFQSALRMRGLFNGCKVGTWYIGMSVSIRLADAWPFQPQPEHWAAVVRQGFNPPCGCVAFSTIASDADLKIELKFQSALRMRGLFNSRSASCAWVSQKSFHTLGRLPKSPHRLHQVCSVETGTPRRAASCL